MCGLLVLPSEAQYLTTFKLPLATLAAHPTATTSDVPPTTARRGPWDDGDLPNPPATDDRAPSDDPPPTLLAAVDAGAIIPPLPLPTRLMDPATLRRFLYQNTDFRRAPLFGVFLPCPYLLATATHTREYIVGHIIPVVPTIHEGSVWDLADPNATIVLTRRNRTANLQLGDSVRQHASDPWRGVEATMVQGPTTDNDH